MFDWIGWAVIAGLGIVIVVGLVRSFVEAVDKDEEGDDEDEKEERDLQAEAWSDVRERSAGN